MAAVHEEYWNQIYQKAPYTRGKAPIPFLTDMLPRLQKGRALDVGMGEGANSVYLSQKGFSVKGFDLSSVALEHAQALARDTGVNIETAKADLDLFLFGLMEYDTIIMTYFKPSVIRYYSEVVRALKQGGTLLVESYTNDEIKEPIGPEDAHKDFYFKSNELLQNLRGMRIYFYHEGLVNNRHVVQCLAQKPSDKDVSKYGLFDMQSGARDSGPTAQQKLAESLFKKKS